MSTRNKALNCLVLIIIACPAVFVSVHAQTNDNAPALEEIIVTAQKREQSIQDVGLTISAFTGDRYRELSRGTLDGLAAQISNVQAYSTILTWRPYISAASD